MKYLIVAFMLMFVSVTTFAQDVVTLDTDSAIVESVVETVVNESAETPEWLVSWREVIEAVLIMAVAIATIWAKKAITREEKIKETTKIIINAGERLDDCDKEKLKALVKAIANKAGVKNDLDAIVDGIKEEIKKDNGD